MNVNQFFLQFDLFLPLKSKKKKISLKCYLVNLGKISCENDIPRAGFVARAFIARNWIAAIRLQWMDQPKAWGIKFLDKIFILNLCFLIIDRPQKLTLVSYLQSIVGKLAPPTYCVAIF